MSQPHVPFNPVAEPTPAKKPARRWLWILIAAAAFVFGIAAGAGVERAKPAAAATERPAAGTVTETYTQTAPPPPPVTVTETPVEPVQTGPATEMGDGTYQVGVDVVAGRYKTDGPPPGGIGICYWARNSDDSGNFEAILANEVLQGPGSVTVNDGEFIEMSGGCHWAAAA